MLILEWRAVCFFNGNVFRLARFYLLYDFRYLFSCSFVANINSLNNAKHKTELTDDYLGRNTVLARDRYYRGRRATMYEQQASSDFICAFKLINFIW